MIGAALRMRIYTELHGGPASNNTLRDCRLSSKYDLAVQYLALFRQLAYIEHGFLPIEPCQQWFLGEGGPKLVKPGSGFCWRADDVYVPERVYQQTFTPHL